MLSIGEELLLLALDEDKGVVGTSATTRDMMSPALAGAALMELVLASRIKAEPSSSGFFTLSTDRGKIKVIDPSPTGDDALDDVLNTITAQTKSKSPFHWIKKTMRFTVSKDAPKIDYTVKGTRYLDRMTEQGILYRKEDRIMGAIRSRHYKLVDRGLKDEIQNKIRAAVSADGNPDPRTAMLISLAVICRATGEFMPPGSRKEIKRRLDEIRDSDPAVKLLVEEARRVQQSRDVKTY